MRPLLVASLVCLATACGQSVAVPKDGPNPSALPMDGGGICGTWGHFTFTDAPDSQPGKTCPHGAVIDGDQPRSFDVHFTSNPEGMTGWSWQENGTAGSFAEVESPQAGNTTSCGAVHVVTKFNETDSIERYVIFEQGGVLSAYGSYSYTAPGSTEPCILLFKSTVQAVP